MTVLATKLISSMHVLLFLIILFVLLLSGIEGENGITCLENERLALLKFKNDLVGDQGPLSTWGPEEGKRDCCKWDGVECDTRTNHVVQLSLSGWEWELMHSNLSVGKISPSLLELEYLNNLGLRSIDFNNASIPEFIGSLAKLQYLILYDCNFGGLIPHHLGNLSMLRRLDLSGNSLLNITDLDFLRNFHSLEYLDLSELDLTKATTWMQTINKLPALVSLSLRSCSLPSILPTPLPLINSSTSLSYVDLSNCALATTSILISFLNMSSSFTYIIFNNNDMIGKIPDALWNLKSLVHLDLSHNMLEGRLPDTNLWNLTSLYVLDLSHNMLEDRLPDTNLWNLTSLFELDLSYNMFEGGFPSGFWNSTTLGRLDLSENLLSASLPHMLKFPNLQYLDLHGNQLVGSVPDLASCTSLQLVGLHGNRFNGTLTKSIGSLSKLWMLDVSSNHLEGVINEAHFLNCSKLSVLDLSLNPNLSVKINSDWKPPFKIQRIRLSFCNLGPEFPYWLLNAFGDQFAYLDISYAQISDTIDKNFWDKSVCFWYLNMSHNQIFGVAPDLSCANFTYVDLSSNEFDSLPLLGQGLEFVNLARNKLSWSLTNICAASKMRFLDLSDNRLSGELPRCLRKLTSLEYFNVGNNDFSGKIPKSLGYLNVLSSLHVRNNSFRGEIPTLLSKCRWLHVLDLGGNNLTGHVPAWIGGSLPMLAVLSLRSNEFYGSLPLTLCHLQNLQLLDLSSNKISGTIPKCMNNFSSMSLNPEFNQLPGNVSYEFSDTGGTAKFYDNINIIWKGQEVEYVKNLILLKAIDLSSNNFIGEIPHEIRGLDGLFALNLSRNSLTGVIPNEIGQLEMLNSLDLSENKISGDIPDVLSQLSHLGVLNLSFNNLSGRIPWNAHLQTFNSSSFIGNSELCGPPLSKPCPEDERPKKPISTQNVDGVEDNGELMTTGFYISMTLGFIVGFWGVYGTLILKESWGLACFKMLINVNDWVFVKIVVNWSNMRMYFQN